MSSQYHVRLVGGQNLTKSRPVFGSQDKLLIANDSSIIGFSTRNGRQNQLIQLNEAHPHHNDKYVSFCLHPVASDFQLFSFTKNGLLLNWNYDDSTLIKEFDLKLNELFDNHAELVWGTVKNYYYDASNHLMIYFTVKYLKENGKYDYRIYVTSTDDLNYKEELIDLMVFDDRRISFGRNQNYLIVIDKVEIYFIGLKNGFKSGKPKAINSKKRFLFKDKLKLVCCNPLKDSFAYTCKDGVIRLITIDTQGNLIGDTKTRLHWHQMQINDMCFSSNGVYLYSVGFESVVVRWNLESFAKNFVSNVGNSIKSISVDENNHNIAITLHNNEIRLISSHFDTISKSLNNLNYFFKKDIETGLVFDPKHDTIVLNGRPGNLQFYSPLTEENVLLFDVVNTRYILKNNKDSKFDDCKAVNIDVFRMAISDCGSWLVTYEMRDDKSTQLETRLKFWKYLKGSNPMQLGGLRTNEDYELHTCINLPHKLAINEMKFSKNSNYLITTSVDGSFKIWMNNRDEYNWYCQFTYTFQNDLQPNHITISFDSSMFAINYSHLLTIWNAKEPNDVKYIDTLKLQDDQEDYISIEFGTGMMSHLLAACTKRKLTVWNVSKEEVKWTYVVDDNEIQFKHMIYCSSTKNLVLLDSVGHLDVFSINSIDGRPLLRLDLDCNLMKHIHFILFINQSNYKFKQTDDLFGDQMLCFMTESKKLFILENQQSKETREKFKLKSEIIETTKTTNAKNQVISNFVQELIDRKANQLKQGDYNLTKSLDTLNSFTEKCNLNKLVDDMFYNVPSHVLPPVQMIAKPFLRSLLNVDNNMEREEEEVKQKKISYIRDVEMMENYSESEGEDGEEKSKKKQVQCRDQVIDLFKNDKLASSFVFRDEDYSFLSK